MIYRLPAQVKAGNTSENVLNKIRKFIYFLHRKKKILKKYITIKLIQ